MSKDRRTPFGVSALALAVLLLATSALAQDRRETHTRDALAFEMGRASLDADGVAAALGIDPALVVSASFGATDPIAYAVFDQAASGFPTQGSNYLVMSSGTANQNTILNGTTGPSVNNNSPNNPPARDIAQLTLVLNVPEDALSFSFDFKFFSTEYPVYVGTAFNDHFLVEIGESNFTFSGFNVIAPNNIVFDDEGELLSINTTGALGMNTANAFGTAWGFNNGATTVLSTAAPIPAGTTQLTLIFSVFDMSDSILDSAVFLDNFRFLDSDGGGTGVADNTPPECSGSVVGGIFQGLATDLLSADPNNRGIASVSLSGTNLVLQNLTPPPPYSTPLPESVSYEVALVDATQPGSGVVTATDGAGNTCMAQVALQPTGEPPPPPPDDTPPVCGAIELVRENGTLVAIVSSASDPQSGIASVFFTTTRNMQGFTGPNPGALSPYAQGQTATFNPVVPSIALRAERINMSAGGAFVVRVTNGAGLSSNCDPVVSQLSATAPEAFAVEAPYPNPARAGEAVRLAFSVAEPVAVRVGVYDVVGREVARLVDAPMEAGRYEVAWDGRDAASGALAAGVYVVRMEAGPFRQALRVTVMP